MSKKKPDGILSGEEEGLRNAEEATLILVGAASFTGSGVKNVRKGVPFEIDADAAGRLIATGLFETEC